MSKSLKHSFGLYKLNQVTTKTNRFITSSATKPSNHLLVPLFVTLYHEMSCNVPDGHFHVFIISESTFYAIYNGENHFQIRGLLAELHALNMMV